MDFLEKVNAKDILAKRRVNFNYATRFATTSDDSATQSKFLLWPQDQKFSLPFRNSGYRTITLAAGLAMVPLIVLGSLALLPLAAYLFSPMEDNSNSENSGTTSQRRLFSNLNDVFPTSWFKPRTQLEAW